MDEEALIQKVMDELSLETLDHYMDIFPQKQSGIGDWWSALSAE